MTVQEAMTRAMRAGFGVSEDFAGWWYVHIPARPRRPKEIQGAFKSADRAWMAAASLAMETSTT